MSEKPMKKNVLRKGHAIALVSLIATMGVAGCELLVDFDRTKIDSGLPDGSIDDASIDASGDQSVTDSPTTDSPTGDSTTDAPTESGADSGTDSSAADTGTDSPAETSTDAGSEAAAEAGTDAAMEAEAASAASLSLTGVTTHDFLNQDVGTTSADFTFTVTNAGGTASSAVTLNLTGTGFVLTAGQDNCSGNAVAANNGTCTFKIHFTPSSDGVKSGSITASATTGGAPSATLAGTGKGLVITPAPTNYGTVTVGQVGTPQTFTVKNNASVTTGTLTTALSGTDAADFSLANNTCTAPLATTATCTVDVNFTPMTTTGAKTAAFGASATGVGGAASVTLNGTAN